MFQLAPSNTWVMKVNIAAALLAVATASVFANSAQAKPLTLLCRHSDNLYAAPYMVAYSPISSTLAIVDDGRTDAYAVEDVAKENGGYVIQAYGKLLNAHITLITSLPRQILYSGAFTNDVFAIDYCR
ncbi:hypothetical protein [Methylocystis rosea]|uniref:Uncharacterized protein n=1 Tax=Methylocystis rosea TaxID=173366 RepID=A0A3G8M6E2_9HYPH|nr:hypothetical protein [Methylocystis rosea]AZG76690.1 hypothetical protein EHO51_08120 [Methylocystis rosea]